jgi:hypothetical protein
MTPLSSVPGKSGGRHAGANVGRTGNKCDQIIG